MSELDYIRRHRVRMGELPLDRPGKHATAPRLLAVPSPEAMCPSCWNCACPRTHCGSSPVLSCGRKAPVCVSRAGSPGATLQVVWTCAEGEGDLREAQTPRTFGAWLPLQGADRCSRCVYRIRWPRVLPSTPGGLKPAPVPGATSLGTFRRCLSKSRRILHRHFRNEVV